MGVSYDTFCMGGVVEVKGATVATGIVGCVGCADCTGCDCLRGLGGCDGPLLGLLLGYSVPHIDIMKIQTITHIKIKPIIW